MDSDPENPSFHGSVGTSASQENQEREVPAVEPQSAASHEDASLLPDQDDTGLKTRRPPTPHRPRFSDDRRRSYASTSSYRFSSHRNRSLSRRSSRDDDEKSSSSSVNERHPSRGQTARTSPTLRATPRSNTKTLARTMQDTVSIRSRVPSSANIQAATPPTVIIQPPVYAYYDRVLSSSTVQSPVGHGLSGSRPRSPASTFMRQGSYTSTSRSRPFLSVDPYPASVAYSLGRGSTTIGHTFYNQDLNKPDLLDYVLAFVSDTIPRQMYIHMLLRLPSLYFSRVARIFDEGDMTLYEIAALAHAPQNRNQGYLDITAEPSSPTSPFWNLKVTWEAFINSLLEEWKTLNIVSVLLLSTILTMAQLPGVVTEPVILYSALASLLCALMSLLYGCVYIIRFGSMRKTYRAIAWAEAAQKSKTIIWWNVWVLLAMPAVWLAWSILLFVFCMMMYVWHIDPSNLSDSIVLGTATRLVPRTIISALVGLGLVYFVLIAITFNQYGEKVDKQWSQSMTDMRMSSFGDLPISYRGSPAPEFFMPPTVVPIPVPTQVVLSPSRSSSRFSSRSPRRSSPLTIPVLPAPRWSGNRSWSGDRRGRRRSRTPDSRMPSPRRVRRGHSPDRRMRSSRSPNRRSRSRSRTPVSRESGKSSSERRRSVSLESLSSKMDAFIPPPRHGIPIVPRDGSTYKVVDLWFHNHDKYPMPAISQQRGLSEDQWELFVFELCAAWDGEKERLKERFQLTLPTTHVRPQDFVSNILGVWNEQLESRHRLQAVLCREYSDVNPESPAWAVYLLDFTPDESGVIPGLAERFGTVPEGLGKVVILDPRATSNNMAVLAKAPPMTTTIARHELQTHVRFRRDDSDSGSG